MDSWIFREWFQGSKPIGLGIYLYHWKSFGTYMSKMACMTHFDGSYTSYGQKKSWESNCQFDYWPLKVKNHLDFLAWRWRATYFWKDLDEGYNFASDLISIEGLRTKLQAPKVVGVPSVGISRLSLGSPRTKWHLGASPVTRHIVYYKGEGGGFPQVQAVVSLMSSCLPMVSPCTKVLQLRTNQLVVCFVQLCVSKWSAYQSS
jgi:hypothetical protein